MILTDKFYGMYLHLILYFTMLNTIYGKAVRVSHIRHQEHVMAFMVLTNIITD